MSGVFIISFDCEGKWGMADHLDARIEESFTTANLLQNYRDLLALLGEHGLRATFAFVGAYTLSAEAFLDRRVEYEPLLSSSWCRVFVAALQRGQFEGWFNAEAARLVARAGGHEIAGHGFSHRPLTPADATRDDVRWELDALRRLDLFHDQSWTLVYPRNQIGYIDELGDHGIVGFRERRQHAFGRASALLSELNVLAAAEPHASDAAAIPIPAGFFLNWRSGARRMVPAAVTVRRWTSLLRDAAKHDRVVHLWSHPHNFLTGDGMLPMFREIVRVAAAMCTRGDLVNMTQIDYAKRVKSLDAIAVTPSAERRRRRD
jgi:hypothetical protein